jgi:hypothetical protein
MFANYFPDFIVCLGITNVLEPKWLHNLQFLAMVYKRVAAMRLTRLEFPPVVDVRASFWPVQPKLSSDFYKVLDCSRGISGIVRGYYSAYQLKHY